MRLVTVAAWMLGGAALASGLYWGFLNTPESTVWALALSAVLLLLVLAVIGITINGAILFWTHGPSQASLLQAGRHAIVVAPAALVVVATWWLTTQAETWVALRTGPINAWFIARFGWGDVTWFFALVRYGAIWMRWVAAGMLAIWLMASLLQGAKYRLSFVRIGLASLWFVVLIALPWAYLLPWRPAGLPATGVEPLFIGAKLLIAAAVISCGAALIVREASPRTQMP